jgi:hypothetical protein
MKKIAFEPSASRTITAGDDDTVTAFCGDGSPVTVTLPADIPAGVMVDVLQWTDAGSVTIEPAVNAHLTPDRLHRRPRIADPAARETASSEMVVLLGRTELSGFARRSAKMRTSSLVARMYRQAVQLSCNRRANLCGRGPVQVHWRPPEADLELGWEPPN